MSYNFQPLVKTLYGAHKNFKETWKKHYVNLKKAEPEEVTKARGNFHTALDTLFNELQKYEKGFFAGETGAIDAILNFIEVDIPAFRCGYAKTVYFRKLKSLRLNEIQKERIGKIAYKMCASENYRREFRDLARLMIKIADEDFLEKIKLLRENSRDIVRFKTDLMLQTIVQNRVDLR